MKLLLTSGGLMNESIINALKSLTQKPFNQLNLAFVPTAANVVEGDKDWLIKDFEVCKSLGFKSFDIVDFSAVPADIWKKRLKDADVILVGGGNTFHLMHCLEQTGLKIYLRELLKTRVYIGISAGTMVATKNLVLSDSPRLYSEDIGELDRNEGLGSVDFHIRPHLNSKDFPNMKIDIVKEAVKDVSEPVYVIDDQTAIKVVNGSVEIISEGSWKKFSQQK